MSVVARNLDYEKNCRLIQWLKVASVLILSCLVLGTSLIFYPARHHFKNKYLTPPLGSYFCCIVDKEGKSIAEGRLTITEAGTHHSGEWRLHPTGHQSFESGSITFLINEGQGKFAGEMDKDYFRIDIGPFHDASFVLRGQMINNKMQGIFEFCGYADCVTLGSFDAIRD